ncbi:MAG: DUF2213 domain-containing protein [Pikeienuella sp.]
MTEIKFTDSATLSGTVRIGDDLLVEAACARTGCQAYLASEMGMVGDGMINVFRPEDAVFDKASLESYAGKPVTVGHPAEMVTADNWKRHSVGEVQDEIARDGEKVRVTFRVRDAAAIKAIEDGTREISMGYTTGVEMRDGVAPDGTKYQAVQTGPIRINHLALVDKARGGQTLRIGDAENWGITPTTHADEKKEVTMTDTLQTVVLGDQAVQVSATDVAIITKFKADAAKAVSDAETAHAKAIADKDAEIAKLDAAKDAAEAKVLSDADLDKRVADRADLIGKAKAIVADVKTDGVSDAAIRKAVVVAKLGDGMSDKAEAYIDARFDILSEDAAQADPFVDGVKNRTPNTGNLSEADKAYQDNLTYLEAAHRNTTAKEA